MVNIDIEIIAVDCPNGSISMLLLPITAGHRQNGASGLIDPAMANRAAAHRRAVQLGSAET
jgi:hypothetical protein